MRVCMCVYVCVKEAERQGKRERERERESEWKCVKEEDMRESTRDDTFAYIYT